LGNWQSDNGYCQDTEQIIATKAVNEMKNVSPEQLKTAEAEWRKANPGKEPTTDDIRSQAYQNFYHQAFTDSGFGTGGKVQLALQAATAAAQGLAGGYRQGSGSGAAPYICTLSVVAVLTMPVKFWHIPR
jgi:filamentous hemagglutinin